MKSKAGAFCMVLGMLLIFGAIALTYMNQKENEAARESAVKIVPQLVEQIQHNTETEEVNSEAEVIPELQIPVELLTEEDKKMTEVEINGNLYIGYISIPALNMELPVMSDWSLAQLKIAPCRYSGSIRSEDMVLMAHNYISHFGPISMLEPGDEVYFTDMDGKITKYAVVGKDVLEATAVEEMTAGDFDLTLFTCTYSGSARITVYCDVIN